MEGATAEQVAQLMEEDPEYNLQMADRVKGIGFDK